MTAKYPGVAYRLGTWFGTKVRLFRLQSLGPKVSEINDFRGFFFVYCGANKTPHKLSLIDLVFDMVEGYNLAKDIISI